jgi:hypothetical protein
LLVVALAGACGQGPPSNETAIVVGVESDPLSGAIGTVQVSTTVGGKVSSTEFATSALPYETRVPAPGDTSAPLLVAVAGYSGPLGTGSTLIARTAETHFVPGETRLLRLHLQASCLLGLPGGPPGAPTCVSPQTCVGGACVSDAVPAQGLVPYSPGWASIVSDVCKPANAGPPVVQVGTGQTDYLPLTDGQTVQMEAGPQGGHHIWIATRQENLRQAGTTTTITSTQAGTQLSGPPIPGPTMSFVFNFEQDQGGFCKLYGLRYQLDVDGADYHQFLGKPLDVTVTLKDGAGATGTGHAHVNIDPALLCPTGATICN